MKSAFGTPTKAQRQQRRRNPAGDPTDIGDDQWVCSPSSRTPYSRSGATWEAFNRDYGPQGDPSVLVATGSSRTFNPSLSQRIVDRAYARDPVAAAAEYGGEWRSDIAAFISRDAITACVDRDVLERPYCQGTRYLAQVDPSGGSNDSFALAISHMEHGQAMLDLVREVQTTLQSGKRRRRVLRGAGRLQDHAGAG